MEGAGRRGEEVEVGDENVEQESWEGILRDEAVLKCECAGTAVVAELFDKWSGAGRAGTAVWMMVR